MNDSEQLDHFIDRMRAGESDTHEFAAMERRLLEDPVFRQQYRERMRMESHLIAAFQTESAQIAPPLMTAPQRTHTKRHWIPALAIGMAAALVIGFFVGSERDRKSAAPVIGHLESSSEAAWTDGGPGGIGAELSAGSMELRSGFAELRLTSGVLVALEAPVRLELIDPMRCRLHHGIAVVDVPESAIGFIVETSDGHAVDHGTRFAVNVETAGGAADFEVLDGSISMHHPGSGSVLPLSDAQAARLSGDGIESLATLPSATFDRSLNPDIVRLETEGREISILRNATKSHMAKSIHPDFLMVKKDITRYAMSDDELGQFARDRRSLLGFNLGKTEPERIEAARLRLNLVPTGLGYASSLPETCTFQVFGVRDDPKLEAWSSQELRWEDAPGYFKKYNQKNAEADVKLDLDEVRLLGSIDLPRGKVTGSIVFESPELTDFLREDTTGQVSFLLVRATLPLDGWSLVHAFAASTHPDAAGPRLELEMADQPKD